MNKAEARARVTETYYEWRARGYLAAHDLIMAHRARRTGGCDQRTLEALLTTGSVGNGSENRRNPYWRSELLLLLEESFGASVDLLCELVEISPPYLKQNRLKDEELENAVVAYQSALFEYMVEHPGPVRPGLVAFGLEARAGWRRRLELTIDATQVQRLLGRVVEIVGRVVTDPEVVELLANELERADLLSEVGLPALATQKRLPEVKAKASAEVRGMSGELGDGATGRVKGEADREKCMERGGYPRSSRHVNFGHVVDIPEALLAGEDSDE